MKLHDKIAIVTGGGQGIGEAISNQLAQEGATVAIADVNMQNANGAAEKIRSQNGKASPFKVDVSSLDSVEEICWQVRDQYGHIDILVNNAGWDKVEPFLDNDPQDWDKVIAINLRGVLNTCKTILPMMIEQGGGKIVNIASDAGRVGSSGEAVYSATKGGIIAFSKTIAREMARHHINVNAVCPGPADTPLFQGVTQANPKIAGALEKAIPFHRLAQPEDIAAAVAYFTSDGASYVTGQTLSVSGGLTMA